MFNPSESCLFKLGKGDQEVLPNLRLNDTDILWLDRFKYLGVTGVYLVTGRSFNIDISVIMQKFYAAANAMLSHSKTVNEVTRLHSLESFTPPMLTYGLNK